MADFALSAEAEADTRTIYRYTAQEFGPEQADHYSSLLEQAALTAANFPLLGGLYSTARGNTFRKYNFGRHALFYQPSQTGIFIVRILHLMTDFDRHLD